MRTASGSDSVDDTEPCPDRPLGIVLMGSRVAEIDQDTVAHVLGDKAIESGDDSGDRAVIGGDDLAQILGRQPPQNLPVDIVVAERGRILVEPEIAQPLGHIH